MTRSDAYGDDVMKRFPKLWNGIGCLKGVQLKLYIDNSVTPLAQKHNRVPFHQRKKVGKETGLLANAFDCAYECWLRRPRSTLAMSHKIRKLSTPCHPKPLVVTNRKGC